jgi:hypothetical protein
MFGLITFKMDHRFKAAREVYLGHTLSTTLEISARLSELNEASADVKCCVAACNKVLRYVRSAKSACGVLGLVAIDRGNERLRACLDGFLLPAPVDADGRTMVSISALCYANSLNRQCQGDFELQELWLFAAKCSDTIARLQPNLLCVVHPVYRYSDNAATLKMRTHLIAKARQFDVEHLAANRRGRTWNSKLLARAAHYCRFALASAQIADLQHSGKSCLLSITQTMGDVMKQQCVIAQSAVAYIERNMPVSYIADQLHSPAVQHLTDLAAQRLLEGLHAVAARRDQHTGVNGLHRGEMLANNASCLANLASALSAVAVTLTTMRANAASVASLSAAVPTTAVQLLDNIEDQLQGLAAEITASANNDTHAAVHVKDYTRLRLTIQQIANKLDSAQSRAATWEERAMQRFLTEAKSVNRGTSPAHPHMAECWLQAATHMRLAVDARAAASLAPDTQLTVKYQLCSKSYEKLATGTFRDSSVYFGRAERATSLFVAQLWQEAAEQLLLCGASQVLRMEETAASEAFSVATLSALTAVETKQLRRVAACAACASDVEGAPAAAVAAAVTLMGFDPTAAGAVTAMEQAAVAGAADVLFTLRLLLVHVERDACVWEDGSGVLQQLRVVAEDTMLLYQVNQVPLPIYPEGHLLYQRAPTAEATQQRDLYPRWLCDIAVGCYQSYQCCNKAQQDGRDTTKVTSAILTALSLLDGIKLYAVVAVNRAFKRPYEHSALSFQQAEVNQVLCRRYLAAAHMLVADAPSPLAHALLEKSAQLHLNQQYGSVVLIAVSNALVRRAWQETGGVGNPLPVQLLLSAPVDSVAALDPTILEQNTAAHVQQAAHQVALGELTQQREATLRKTASEFYACVTRVTMALLSNTTDGGKQQLQEICARASRAATWGDLAITSFRDKKSDVAKLYERATHFSVVVDTDGHGLPLLHDKTETPAQLVGDKAALRFVEAAHAFSAEDRGLYQRWLQAAEATASLVAVSHRASKPSAPRKIAFSAEYSLPAMREADHLEAHARARRTPTAPTMQSPKKGTGNRVDVELKRKKRK